MPEISVIVPVYKVEAYLDRCVKSIINQTFTDFELILVDDGSPDNCPKICDEWKKRDTRIHVIHKKNGGLSSARNVGLEIFKGNYVFFVDSDDWIEKDALEILYKVSKEKNADIVVGKHVETIQYGMCERNYSKKCSLYTKDEYLDMFLKITDQKTRYYAWAKLYKSKIARFIKYPEGYTSEDVEGTFYAISKAKCIVEIDYIVYHYFINKKGISKGVVNGLHKDMYHVWKNVVKYTEKEMPMYVEKVKYNLARLDLSVLMLFVFRPISEEYLEYKTELPEVKKRLDQNYRYLMKGALPWKKKVVLLCCRFLPTNFWEILADYNFKHNKV